MSPYPIILGGDHAAFEAEWAASGKPDNERPDWPHPSFDARDWAAAFCKIANEHGFKDAKGEPIDEGWMIGWFANALMRGYDEAGDQVMTREPDAVALLMDQFPDGHPAADELVGLRSACGKLKASNKRLQAVIVRAKDALLDGQSTQCVHDLLVTALLEPKP